MKKGTDAKPTFSVVICTRNRPESLTRCIASVLAQSYVPEEIIIVDDASREPITPESVVPRNLLECPGFIITKLIIARNERTQGITKSRNRGILQASMDIIAFMDDDSYADPAWIENLGLNYLDKRIIGAGGPFIEVGREVPVKSKVKRVAMITSKGEFTGHHRRVSIEQLGKLKRQWVCFLQGGNMSFRRNTLIDIGGFDTEFKGNAYGEETDLCLRARKKGKIIFDPRAFTYHHSSMIGGNREQIRNDTSTFLYWFFRNRTLFFLKHYSPRRALSIIRHQVIMNLGYVVREKTLPTRKYVKSTSLLRDIISSMHGISVGLYAGFRRKKETIEAGHSAVGTYNIVRAQRGRLVVHDTTPLIRKVINQLNWGWI